MIMLQSTRVDSQWVLQNQSPDLNLLGIAGITEIKEIFLKTPISPLYIIHTKISANNFPGQKRGYSSVFS